MAKGDTGAGGSIPQLYGYQAPNMKRTFNQFPSAQENLPEFPGIGGTDPALMQYFAQMLSGQDQPLPGSQISGMGSTYGQLPGVPQSAPPTPTPPSPTPAPTGGGIKGGLSKVGSKIAGAMRKTVQGTAPTGTKSEKYGKVLENVGKPSGSPIQTTGEFYRTQPMSMGMNAGDGLSMPDMDMTQLNRYLRHLYGSTYGQG